MLKLGPSINKDESAEVDVEMPPLDDDTSERNVKEVN
jgi:hypothetical protein